MAKGALQGKDLTDYLDEIERAGMLVTKQWHDVWRTAVQYMWGEQLSGIVRNPDWDYIVTNMIYPLVMQGVAKLSKNQPNILARAWDESETEWAERWQGLIRYVWEQVLDMRVDTIMAMLDSAVYGYAVGKTYWEPRVRWDDDSKDWMGEVAHRLIHPCSVWFDPKAERIRDAENCGTIRKVSLSWAQKQWPTFAKEIEESADDPDDLAGFEYKDAWGFSGGSSVPVYANQRTTNGLRAALGRFVGLIFGRHDAQVDADNATDDAAPKKNRYVWVRETYFRDPQTEHVKIEDEAGEQQLMADGIIHVDPADPMQLHRWTANGNPVDRSEWPKVTRAEYDKPAYPNGRVVIRVGEIIVNPDIKQQRYNRKRWPFNVLPYHILPHMWQGSNAIEMSRGPQDMLNVTMAYILQHVKMTACPQKVIEVGTLAKNKQGKIRIVKDRAGELIVVNKGGVDKIRNLVGNRLDPTVWTLIQYLVKDIETQQFMHAVAQGKATSSGMSATEAARLDTNANDLIFLRSVLLERWIEGTARNIAEVIQENYDEDKRVRIVGCNGEVQPGRMTADMKNVSIDLEIEPGTTLPFDETRQKQDYLTAYKLCADPNLNPMLEDVLRKLNISNIDKILSKHQQIQLFKQFIALAQAAKNAAAQIRNAASTPGPDGAPVDPARLQMAAAAVQQQIIQKVMQLLAQAGQIQAQSSVPQGQPQEAA